MPSVANQKQQRKVFYLGFVYPHNIYAPIYAEIASSSNEMNSVE